MDEATRRSRPYSQAAAEYLAAFHSSYLGKSGI
jgi:hypothetical protein